MNYLLKRVTLITLISVFSISSYAQYGNEWINSNQTYFKFKISEEGVFRLNQSTLASAGMPVTAVNPKNIQIFRHGEEQRIYVSGQSDNSFDASDYIEFYAKPNDGELDASLYQEPSQHPNIYQSLFNDDAVYFITWSTTELGDRLIDFYDSSYSGKATDSWFWHSSIKTFDDAWYDGTPYFDLGYESEYTTGEGWFSQAFWDSRELKLDVDNPNYYSSGPQTSYEIYAGGKYNPENYDGAFNQEMTIKVGGVKALLHQKKFVGYEHFLLSDTLSSTQVGLSQTPFYFSSTLLDKARQAVSYIKLDYPRAYDIDGKSSLEYVNSGTNTHVLFSDYESTKSHPYVLDTKNHQRIKGDIISGDLHYNLSVADSQYLYIYDSTDAVSISSSEIMEATFAKVDKTKSYDYIILTHKKLQSGAEQYKDYRESSLGGSHDVLLVYTEDLYNEFFYGYHHPSAVRQFCEFALNELDQKPENLLLLGKGRKYSESKANDVLRDAQDLVPTYGWPASDILFSADLDNDKLAPAFATGRIPCKDNVEVLIYLDKVKQHEKDSFSSRDYVQVTGGTNSEQQFFQNIQNQYYAIVEQSGVATNKIAFEKSGNPIIDTTFKKTIPAAINQGVSVVSILSHAAANVLEVDWGQISDWNNKGKYPLIIGGGQSLGDVYGYSSITEDLFFTRDKGAIAVFAPTRFYFIDPMRQWTVGLHKAIFQDNANESFGEQLIATVNEYQDVSDQFNKSQCLQMNYYGDPVLKMYHQYSTLSIVQHSKETSNIKLYPNPTHGSITIQGDKITEIKVCTLAGKQVLSTDQSIINLQGSAPGMYLIEVISGEERSYHKVILD